MSLIGRIGQVSLPVTANETQESTPSGNPQVLGASTATSPFSSFVAQNEMHPLLREAQQQVVGNDALVQQSKAAEAQDKAKTWSMVGAIFAVVVADVIPTISDVSNAPRVIGNVVPDDQPKP